MEAGLHEVEVGSLGIILLSKPHSHTNTGFQNSVKGSSQRERLLENAHNHCEIKVLFYLVIATRVEHSQPVGCIAAWGQCDLKPDITDPCTRPRPIDHATNCLFPYSLHTHGGKSRAEAETQPRFSSHSRMQDILAEVDNGLPRNQRADGGGEFGECAL